MVVFKINKIPWLYSEAKIQLKNASDKLKQESFWYAGKLLQEEMKSVFPFAAKDLIVCGLEFFLRFYIPLLLQVPFTVEKEHS